MSRYQSDLRELGKQVIYNHQQWLGHRPPTARDVRDALNNWYPDAWQTKKTGDPDEVAKRAGKTEHQFWADLVPVVMALLAEAQAVNDMFQQLGFEYIGTGGGCDAFQKELPGDPEDPPHFMVTDEDASVPLYWDQDVVFGYYSEYGDEGEVKFYPTVQDLVADLQRGGGHPKWSAPARATAKSSLPQLAQGDLDVINRHRKMLGQQPIDLTKGWTAKELEEMARNIRKTGRTHNPRRLSNPAVLKRRLL